MTDYSVSDRTAGLNTGLNDSTTSKQIFPIDPSSGELLVIDNFNSGSYEQVVGGDSSNLDSHEGIRGNGEVNSINLIQRTDETKSKSMWGDIESQVMVGVIVAVISAVIIVALTRRK